MNLFKKKKEYSPAELKTRMEENPDLFLLDVRMPVEFDMANLGGTLIPLPELPDRLSELEEFKQSEVVVMCRSGARSLQAQALLSRSGFERVINLAGGILAWSETVDSTIPKY